MTVDAADALAGPVRGSRFQFGDLPAADRDACNPERPGASKIGSEMGMSVKDGRKGASAFGSPRRYT